MYNTYIIETRKGTAGIVVRDGRGFRFFAATQDFNDLEGRVFATPKEAEAAALRRVNAAGIRPKPPETFDNAPAVAFPSPARDRAKADSHGRQCSRDETPRCGAASRRTTRL